jgi:hypothetical protein
MKPFLSSHYEFDHPRWYSFERNSRLRPEDFGEYPETRILDRVIVIGSVLGCIGLLVARHMGWL